MPDTMMQAFENYGSSTTEKAKLADDFEVVLMLCRKIMRAQGSINKHLMAKWNPESPWELTKRLSSPAVEAPTIVQQTKDLCLCCRAPETFECSVKAGGDAKVRDLTGEL